MKKFLNFVVAIFLFACTSCDVVIGESGVVEDSVTGERLSDVVVKMTSSQGNVTDTTDANGYFKVIKTFSCGFDNCGDNYDIEFIARGYDTLTIGQSFYSSEDAAFVNDIKKDTLLIKLQQVAELR